MSSRAELRLDWCSHAAAKFAVEKYHYSHCLPAFKAVRIGCWEDDRFCGVLLFGCGANRNLARPYGLKDTEVAELTRVALAPGRDHPTSRCVAIALKMLRRQSPGLRLVVSYADAGQGHRGVIYQASGWYYVGAGSQAYLRCKGRIVHPRSLYDRFGRGGQSVTWLREHVDPRAERVAMPSKLKYIYVLDPTLRPQIEVISLPYVKSLASIESDASGDQPEEGGASPTAGLQSSHA